MWLARGRPAEARRLYERALDTAASIPDRRAPGDRRPARRPRRRTARAGRPARLPPSTSRPPGSSATPGRCAENRHRWYAAMAGLRRARATSTPRPTCSTRPRRSTCPASSPTSGRSPPPGRGSNRPRPPRRRAGVGARARRPATDPDLPGRVRPAHPRPAAGRRGDRAARRSSCSTGVLDAAEAAGREGSVVEAGLVRALAHHADGDADTAAADLAARWRRRAGRLLPALPRRGRADGGAARAGRARGARRSGARRAPARRPRNRCRAAPARTRRRKDSASASSRCCGCWRPSSAGPEIAWRLFVSVNTLRTHTKHIFTKLDVNTRRPPSPGRDLDLLWLAAGGNHQPGHIVMVMWTHHLDSYRPDIAGQPVRHRRPRNRHDHHHHRPHRGRRLCAAPPAPSSSASRSTTRTWTPPRSRPPRWSSATP